MARPVTPILWLVFSAGGTVASLLFPIHVFLTGLAFPLGWLDAPGYQAFHGLVSNPVVRLYLFVLISLPLFHWAHRFRYTLYDGFQLYHLYVFIAVLCYGTATVGTLVAAYVLLSL
jgi:fumarate reductase subunit D